MHGGGELERYVRAAGLSALRPRRHVARGTIDLRRGTVSGEPKPIVEQIQYNTAAGVANFSATEDGLLVFASGTAAAKNRLTWVDRN